MRNIFSASDKREHQVSPLVQARSVFRSGLFAIGIFSGVINVLMLTGAIFMLQVYDRVLPSGSIPTLIALIVIAALLFLFQGILEWIRGRLLVRVGRALDAELNEAAYRAIIRLPLIAGQKSESVQPVRDLDQVRSFISGAGPTALFDLPWLPLYLAICFLFHFWIGFAALVGAVLLVAITLLTEVWTRAYSKPIASFSSRRTGLAEETRRNAEVVQGLGMTAQLTTSWLAANRRYMDSQQQASDVVSGFSAASRVTRLMLQSAVLAVGAYLVIQGEATAGIIIASSILTSRALAPVELAIAHWKGFIAARQGWSRLTDLIEKTERTERPLDLPAPSKSIVLENVSVCPPGEQRFVVQDVSFRLEAGAGLGIIGPSASGKSSLARTVIGAWAATRGKVRLDGAAVQQWSPDKLGRYVGYLPQAIELFEGTVAQNISRFDREPDAEAIIAAAQQAHVHELILRLPDGYETQVGDRGNQLSAGQKQRIALARALYGQPFLVVLDEPNSNLDTEGDQALAQAILGVRQRGGIAIVIAHRPSALANTDTVLAMANGRVQAFGPKDEVLQKVLAPRSSKIASIVKPAGEA